MPEQIIQRDRPELGFVSVGQYLDANRGTVDRDYNKARTDAAAMGQGFAPLWGGNAPNLPGTSTPPGPGSTQVEGLSSYLDQAQKATEMGRTFQNPGALASSAQYGRDLTGRGPGTFSAALQFAKYGDQYKQLGDYLNQFSRTAVEERYPKPGAGGGEPTPELPPDTEKPPTNVEYPEQPTRRPKPPSGGTGRAGMPSPPEEAEDRRGERR